MTEKAVIQMAYKHPNYGRERVSKELQKKSITVTSDMVRRIWNRHGLNNIEKRLAAIENKVG